MQKANLEAHEKILSLILSYWQARAVAVATELVLPDILAKGPLHVDELARRSNTNAPALFRLMRALESVGIFSQTSPRTFANTERSECLRKGVPDSQWPMVLHYLSRGNGTFDGWDELEYSVRTGMPSIDKIYGYDFWELCRRNPQADEAMNEGMRSLSELITPSVTAAYEWNQFPLVADVGGGIGTQLISILDASPTSKGILFDRPHVAAKSTPHHRMRVVGGSFFESVPAGADAYLLRWILHDWAEPEAAAILRSLRRSMKPTARLILAEFVIPEGGEFDFSKWTDLQMLILFKGRERTVIEHRNLLAASGFELEATVSTASQVSLLVARPV
jgi:O-methyltransferase domain/Dimerisation domain